MHTASSDLVELVFERLDEGAAVELSRRIYGSPVAIPTENGVSEVDIQTVALRDDLHVRRVHLRILRYEDSQFDLEMNFELGDVPHQMRSKLAAALHHFAKLHSDAAGVQNYYAGLEPAVDEDTRIFTGKETGPYSLM